MVESKSKPYVEQHHGISFGLTAEILEYIEQIRWSFYDGNDGYTLNLRTVKNSGWDVGLNMEVEWGNQISEELCQRISKMCKEKHISELYAVLNINVTRDGDLKKAINSYKDNFDPPLACSVKNTTDAIYGMNVYEYSLTGFYESFLIFPINEEFLILVSWEKNCQIIAGPKETVEYLINGNCKDSWQILSEDWAYTDPDRNYSDLRQFAHELGYFDGKI
jgi:hypothetical protein